MSKSYLLPSGTEPGLRIYVVESWWVHPAGLSEKREMEGREWQPQACLKVIEASPFPSKSYSLPEWGHCERPGKRKGEEPRTSNHLTCQVGALQEPKRKMGLLPQSHSERNGINRGIFANEVFLMFKLANNVTQMEKLMLAEANGLYRSHLVSWR